MEFRDRLDKFKFVSDIKESDFILACTPFENTEPLDYIPILKNALDLNLIMFCANPDYITIKKGGHGAFRDLVDLILQAHNITPVY